VFVRTADDGTVSYLERDDLDAATAAAWACLDGAAGGLITHDDVTEAARALDPGSCALFVVWEDRWAADLGRALRAAGGQLVIGERIPHDAITAAIGTTEATDPGR
jgi:hypothetical protein